MSDVAGSFCIGMIIDGDSAQGNIRSTKPLVQMYQKDTGKCVPDWSVAANQPVIYPVMRSGNENVIKPIVSGTEKWHYNNTPITFNASGLATAPAAVAGKMQTTTYNNGAVNVPALKIVGNLASASNMDADTIRMDGEIEASGHNLAYTSEIPLAISEFSNSAYYGFLYPSDGGIIDGDTATVKVTQELYKGGSLVPQSNYSLKWYKMPSTTAWSTANSVSLVADDVDSKLSVRAEFIIGGEVVATAICEVSDETDPLFLAINYSGPTMLTSSGTTSEVTATYKVKKTGTGEEVSGFTFTTAFTKTNGAAFTPANAPTTTGCKLTYADVKSAGGNITGYIQGTKS